MTTSADTPFNSYNPKRAKVGYSKLTPRQRNDIVQRKDEGDDPKALALEYGVTAAYIKQL